MKAELEIARGQVHPTAGCNRPRWRRPLPHRVFHFPDIEKLLLTKYVTSSGRWMVLRLDSTSLSTSCDVQHRSGPSGCAREAARRKELYPQSGGLKNHVNRIVRRAQTLQSQPCFGP